jgi:hypothetical protein
MDSENKKIVKETISTVENFIEYIRDDWQGIRLYRGQSKDWLLSPKIGRLKHRDEITVSETEMLERFKEQSVPFLQMIPRTDREWLALAQHHGLPTRLLDGPLIRQLRCGLRLLPLPMTISRELSGFSGPRGMI